MFLVLSSVSTSIVAPVTPEHDTMTSIMAAETRQDPIRPDRILRGLPEIVTDADHDAG